jgi:hypothetical protein
MKSLQEFASSQTDIHNPLNSERDLAAQQT